MLKSQIKETQAYIVIFSFITIIFFIFKNTIHKIKYTQRLLYTWDIGNLLHILQYYLTKAKTECELLCSRHKEGVLLVLLETLEYPLEADIQPSVIPRINKITQGKINNEISRLKEMFHWNICETPDSHPLPHLPTLYHLLTTRPIFWPAQYKKNSVPLGQGLVRRWGRPV